MLILAAILFLFVACGSEESATPARGSVSENTFTNSQLQLQVKIPADDWQIYTDADIAAQTDPLSKHSDRTVGFFARNPFTESTIAITFQPIQGNPNNFSLTEFLHECGANEATHFAAHDLLTLHRLTGLTPLAGMNWQTKRTEIYAPDWGVIAVQFHLSLTENGYIHCIHILADNDTEFNKIASWFTWYRH
jgi:hypothetical protein